MEDVKIIYVDTLTDVEPERNYLIIDGAGNLYRGEGSGVAPTAIADTKFSIFKGDYRTEAATTTLLLDDGILEMTAAGTVDLFDAASSRVGQIFFIKNTSAGVVTLDPNLAQTIEGAATYNIAASEGVVIASNQTEWKILSKYSLGGGGAGGGATQIEQNLSATPTWRGKFTVADALISPTSKINIWQAFAPLTGKGTRADENEMDTLIVNAEAGTGQMTVYWQTQPQYTMSPPDPQGNGIDTRTLTQDSNKALWTMKRIGEVKGNFKFNYTIN